MELHSRTLPGDGPRTIFLHGVFGQGRNWTQVAKALTDVCRPTLLDLPNHGRSDWTEDLDYVEMADAVADVLRTEGGSEGGSSTEPWVVVGHSMGGKVAMVLALRHPELVDRLAAVDISPVSYGPGRGFDDILEGLGALDLTQVMSREDADTRLSEYVGSPTVRAFLLQNLRRDGDGWRWQMNLDLIREQFAVLSGWPADAVADCAPFDRTTVWIAGGDSDYVTPEYADAMRGYFPRARLVTIKDAGHWVHSQQPEVTTQTLRAFLTATE